MLKDRRELVIQELAKKKKAAAQLYLQAVQSFQSDPGPEYEKLREEISDLDYDLTIINQLILEGNP